MESQENKIKRMYIGKFYTHALVEFDLSPVDGLLIYLIYSLSLLKGFCYASKEMLAKIMNVSVVTVYSSKKRLTKKGLVIGQITDKTIDSLSPLSTLPLKPTEKWNLFIQQMEETFKSTDSQAPAIPTKRQRVITDYDNNIVTILADE